MSRFFKAAGRALADYSLRRFVAYALNPLHWPRLAALRAQRKRDCANFATTLSGWRQLLAEDAAEDAPHTFYRPWLAPARMAPPEPAGPACATDADPELRMRVDRLGWLLERTTAGPAVWDDFLGWCAARRATGLAYTDSYTLSERLANLILLWCLFEPPQAAAKAALKLIAEEAEQLLAHPEYHGDAASNNHILNNARALMLAGAFRNCARHFDAGRWILERELPRHFHSDGTLREASSHYQWIVVRWLIDVACACTWRDSIALERLRPLLAAALDACEGLLLGPPGRCYLPLIGDISPDFSPVFNSGLVDFGRRVLTGVAATPPPVAAGSGLWQRWFGAAADGGAGNWLSAEGGWARLELKPWGLLTHAETHPEDNRTTHGHHDLYGFELAFDGIPLVVDAGRRDYFIGRDTEQAGILDEWHNGMIIGSTRNGLIARGYMPPEWLQRIRPLPRLDWEEDALVVSVESPPGNAGILRCSRRFFVAPDGHLHVVSSVETKREICVPVRLMLYVAGSIIGGGASHLEVNAGGYAFYLHWLGLEQPRQRAAMRYIGYASSAPCTRLEWEASATGCWNAEFVFERRQH